MHEPVSARALLRQATQDAHRRVDALFAAGLPAPSVYVAYLQGMRAFLAAAASQPGLGEPIARLEHDLAAVGARIPPRPAALALPEPAALGWRYVIDGSSHGARILLRQALALGCTTTHGARFLAAHAGGERWSRTLAELDASSADPGQRDLLCAGAIAAFTAAHDALLGALATHRSATPA